MNKPSTPWRYGALMLAGLAAWAVNTIAALLGGRAGSFACAALFALWAAACAWEALSRRKRSGSEERIVSLALAGGFVMGLCFILQIQYVFSHDVGFYGLGENGHMGYIAYIAQNGALPLMDPVSEGNSVFYNPPLHHLIAAGFLRLNLLLGLPERVALENLQVLTLLYASACPLIVLDLAGELRPAVHGRLAAVLVMAFQPMLWLLGATLCNDMLSIAMIMACLLFTVRWERTRRMADIVGAAITLGLGMAAKLSAALLIPCMAMVFAVAFLRDIKRWKRYIGQFAVFLTLSVPLGAGWPLFHLIKYDVPLNYVRRPPDSLYVGDLPLLERFGLPNADHLRTLFFSSSPTTESNVWMTTLKTGAFDELRLFRQGTALWYAAYAFFALFVVLLIWMLVRFVRMLLRRGGMSGLSRGFLGLYGGLLIVNYLKFCVEYPYYCTFNFRYIAPVLALCALGAAADVGRAKPPLVFAACFAGLGTCLYCLYFLIA